MDPFLKRLREATAPEPKSPEQEAAELAASRADLSRRLEEDIAATNANRRPPRHESGTFHFPKAMLDALGLEEMDQ